MYTVDGVLHINPTCINKTTATIVLTPRDTAGRIEPPGGTGRERGQLLQGGTVTFISVQLSRSYRVISGGPLLLRIFRWIFCLGTFCPEIFCRRNNLSGEHFVRGPFYPGTFCPETFCPGTFCPRNILSAEHFVRGYFVRGPFVRGTFCPRNILSGDFLSGNILSEEHFVRDILSGTFCPGTFCPVTIKTS
jgi:hypothetical protein